MASTAFSSHPARRRAPAWRCRLRLPSASARPRAPLSMGRGAAPGLKESSAATAGNGAEAGAFQLSARAEPCARSPSTTSADGPLRRPARCRPRLEPGVFEEEERSEPRGRRMRPRGCASSPSPWEAPQEEERQEQQQPSGGRHVAGGGARGVRLWRWCGWGPGAQDAAGEAWLAWCGAPRATAAVLSPLTPCGVYRRKKGG